MSESKQRSTLVRCTGEARQTSENHRYRVRIECDPGFDPSVSVDDLHTGETLLAWQGALANHLLQSGALPGDALRRAIYSCDKTVVRHLTLSCTAARLALDQIAELEIVEVRPRSMPRLRPVASTDDLSSEDRLEARLDEVGRRLPGPHLLVAKTLFERRGEHFCEADVVCLLSLECPSMRTSLIHTCLDDLTAWDVIQRIVIDSENVFYDIDRRPHLHIFDPATRRLTDAPSTGVVSLEASA